MPLPRILEQDHVIDQITEVWQLLCVYLLLAATPLFVHLFQDLQLLLSNQIALLAVFQATGGQFIHLGFREHVPKESLFLEQTQEVRKCHAGVQIG